MNDNNQLSHSTIICSQRCKKHLFSLKPLMKQQFQKKKVNFSLCPKSNKFGKNIKYQWPEVNLDGKPYFPLFWFGKQKIQKQRHQQEFINEFNEVQLENEKSQTQILIPFPSGKICGVCKIQYKDYLDHIDSQSHKKLIKRNGFEKNIQQLQQLLYPKNNKSSTSETRFSQICPEQYEQKISVCCTKQIQNQKVQPQDFIITLIRKQDQIYIKQNDENEVESNSHV